MNHVLAIARVTYREAVRNRVLYSLLFFVVVMILVSSVLDQMTMGQSGRVVLDLGLAWVQLFAALIAIFLGVALMSREIAKKTLYAVLAKPVGRIMFLVGKYLGLLATLAVLVAIMGVSLTGVVAMFGVSVGLPLLHALAMIWVELALLAAAALVFSVFTGPFLSGMFSLGVFAIGHLTPGLKNLGEVSGDPFLISLTRVLYYVMPNLEAFNFKTEALYQVPVDWGATGLTVLYGAAYAGALLTLAGIIFTRRDFR